MGIRWTKIGQGLQATYHETRKHGRKPDMYIRGRYTVDSETKTIGFGWQSEFAEGEKARVKKEGSKRAYQSFLDHCIGELSRLKKNAQTGSGPTTIKEERQAARKKEEEQKALELKGRKEAEQLQIKLIPFADFFEQVYWPIATSSKKSESYRKEREHFNKWISPVIGKMPFKEIKKDDIEKIKWRMQGEKKSPRSLEYVLSTVRLVWNAAIEEEIIDRPCPTKKIKFDMPDNSRDRYLTDDESEELLSKLRESSEQVYLISLASLETGARFSEIARLKWGDVDIESETLTFRDTKKAGGTKKRSVPMTQALKSMFQEMDRGSRAELVFKDRTGKQLRKVSNTFPKTVAALGLNDGIDDPRQKICYHSLRHSAASRMIQAGIDIFLVQKLLGHSVIRVTEKYSHLSDDTLRDAVKQMEKTRNKKKSPKVMNLR